LNKQDCSQVLPFPYFSKYRHGSRSLGECPFVQFAKPTPNPDLCPKIKNMTNTTNHDDRFAKMTFASVYPHYLAKVEKKGRTKEELHQVIEWLTGYDEARLQALMDEKASFEKFFQQATLNPNARLITGAICGYRVEEIENPLTQQVRYLDKLVD
jgi:hypothetical protein